MSSVRAAQEEALEACRKDPWALQRAAPEFRANPDIVREAVRQNGRALRFAAQGLRADPDFVREAVRSNGVALAFAAPQLQADPDFVRGAVSANRLALLCAAPQHRADPSIVREAIRQDGLALDFATEDLRADPSIVVEAVRQHGRALEFAALELRASPDIVEDAVRQNGRALEFAAQELQADLDIVLEAVCQDSSAFRYARDGLDTEEGLLTSIAGSPRCLSCLSRLFTCVMESRRELADAREQLVALKEHCKAVEADVESLRQQLDAERAEWSRFHEEAIDHRPLLGGLSMSAPYMREVIEFSESIPGMQPSDELVMIPIGAIRFTHHTVSADLAFGKGHDNQQESVFKLLDDLLRRVKQPEDVEELAIFIHTGPDGKRGLFSRCNRRAVALQWFQAVRRDVAIRVPCRVYASDDERPSPVFGKSLRQWFETGYDEQGPSRDLNDPECNGLGWSIWPRFGRDNLSKHRGYELFNPARTTIRSLENAKQRRQQWLQRAPWRQGDGRQPDRTLYHVERALAAMKRKRVRGQDEETITLRSQSVSLARPRAI